MGNLGDGHDRHGHHPHNGAKEDEHGDDVQHNHGRDLKRRRQHRVAAVSDRRPRECDDGKHKVRRGNKDLGGVLLAVGIKVVAVPELLDAQQPEDEQQRQEQVLHDRIEELEEPARDQVLQRKERVCERGCVFWGVKTKQIAMCLQMGWEQNKLL